MFLYTVLAIIFTRAKSGFRPLSISSKIGQFFFLLIKKDEKLQSWFLTPTELIMEKKKLST